MKQFFSNDLKKGLLKSYREDRIFVCYRKLSGRYVFRAFRSMAERDKVSMAWRRPNIIVNINPVQL